MQYSADIKKLVVARLLAVPSNVSFSIGGSGEFSSRELIEEVRNNTEIGNATVEMQLAYVRKIPLLSSLASE